MNRKTVDVEVLSEELQHLYAVINDESDLPCVLIATSYLDHALGSLLKRFFVQGSSTAEGMLDKGALSNFASRYELAYCLGLIPKGLFQNLKIFAEMRNLFAHRYALLTFDNTEVSQLVSSLTLPQISRTFTIAEPGGEPQPFNLDSILVSGPTRAKFNLLAIFMLNVLLGIGATTESRNEQLTGWQ